jgi:hypothetical protein
MKPKRRMQDVRFRTVDEFLDYLPEDQYAVTVALRDLVLDAIPDVMEHLAYNVPYYKRRSNICFIWPGAIPWGKQISDTVRLGFTKGYLLEDTPGYLDKGTRKQVYWRDFRTVSDIDTDIVTAYLTIACEIDNIRISTDR